MFQYFKNERGGRLEPENVNHIFKSEYFLYDSDV